MDELLPISDVAHILGVSPKTVHRFVREGRLGCYEITRKQRLFSHDQVKQFLSARCRIPKPIDRRPSQNLSYPPKGGEKSAGVDLVALRKEMREWQ